MTSLQAALPKFFAVFLIVLAISFSHTARAQVPEAATGTADPGRVQDRFDEEDFMPSVEPSVEVKDVILQRAPQGAEQITFQLRRIQIDGATAYTPAQLESVYADRLGTTVSLADVYAISTALTTKYRNDGYILTQVVVPPQTIEGGIVSLRVVEGYVDRVIIEGADSESELKAIRGYASGISANGEPLNVRDLERYLLLINDLPGLEARSVLSPSPTQTGASDLRIIVSRDSFDALLAIDNHGSRYLGPVQLSAAASVNSFLGLNERFTAQTVIVPDSGELQYFSVSYDQPFGNQGSYFHIAANHSNTEPGHDLDIFNVEGKSDYLSLKVTHPFIRSRQKNLTAHVMMDWRDVFSKNIIDRREDRIRAVRAGARYEFLDTLFGVGLNAFSIEVAKGLNIFNASNEGDTTMSRVFADPQFFKVSGSAQRLQRITSSMNLLVAARGQWSAHPLLSSEEFGVGGYDIGRAFDPSEIIGDEGVAGKVELQWNKPYPVDFLHDYQLYSFYDAGTIWNKDATTSSLKTDTITSAGAGFRADIFDDVELGMALAFPLNRDVQTQDDDDPRFYFNLKKDL